MAKAVKAAGMLVMVTALARGEEVPPVAAEEGEPAVMAAANCNPRPAAALRVSAQPP